MSAMIHSSYARAREAFVAGWMQIVVQPRSFYVASASNENHGLIACLEMLCSGSTKWTMSSQGEINIEKRRIAGWAGKSTK